MAKRITKALVKNIKPPSWDQVCIWDDQLKGFGIRITHGGFKSFVFQTRIKGRLRRITLKPEYPTLSVAQARQEATQLKAAIGRGEDPVLERQQERRAATFGDLVAAYLRNAEVRKVRSLPRAWRRLEQHTSRWTSRKASDISREDLAKLHHTIAEERGHVIANRTVTLVRTIFNYALDRGLFKGENPAARIKMFHEEARTRFLTTDELVRVNGALAQEPNEF
jgi:hypothetical protein